MLLFALNCSVGGCLLRIARLIAAGLAVGLISGCGVLDGSIDDRFDSIDRSAGKSRNESVLRNIARASENIPLTFVNFSKVTGGLTATGNAASPSFILGPHAASNIFNRDAS